MTGMWAPRCGKGEVSLVLKIDGGRLGGGGRPGGAGVDFSRAGWKER